MGQALSMSEPDDATLGGNTTDRLRARTSRLFGQHSGSADEEQEDSSVRPHRSRRSSMMLLNHLHSRSSAMTSDHHGPRSVNASQRRSRFLRRAQSSIYGSIPTLFNRRTRPADNTEAQTSTSSLVMPSASPDINIHQQQEQQQQQQQQQQQHPSLPRHAISDPINYPISLSSPNLVPQLEVDESELEVTPTTSNPSLPNPRRSSLRPSSVISDRLSALRPERLSRSMSNSLRRRRIPPSPRADDQIPVLSQLLSAAAAATAASLMGDDPNAVANARNVGGEEGTLEGFLESLQNGRMASALRRSGLGGEDQDANGGPQGINFVRLFRFGTASTGSGRRNNDDLRGGANDGGALSGDDEGGDGRMVPIIIVGIRSINPGGQDDANIPSFIDALSNFPDPPTPIESPLEGSSRQPQNGTRFSHRRRASMGGVGTQQRSLDPPRPFSAASETSSGPRPPPSTPASAGLSAFSSGATTPTRIGTQSTGPSRRGSFVRRSTAGLESTAEEAPLRRTARGRRLSESDFTRFGSGSSRRNGMVEPDDAEAVSRSWIIYVLGGSYPENHPLLNTPSLFTDSPTYEDMLLLSSLLGPAKPPVASEDDVASAPGLFRIIRSPPETLHPFAAFAIDGEERLTIGLDERCLVCLCDYEVDEEARRLVNCGHLFHKDCIDQWLTTGRNSCPLCRGEGVKKNPDAAPDSGGSTTPVSQAA